MAQGYINQETIDLLSLKTRLMGHGLKGQRDLACGIIGGAAGGYLGGSVVGKGGAFLGGQVIENDGVFIFQPEGA
jgi:hypothetical protein